MARGHTDWLRRPAYGEAVEITDTEIVASLATETLATVTGRGVVIGGWFTWTTVTTGKSLACGIKTEGTVVQQDAAIALLTLNQCIPGCQPLYLSLYDDTGFKYCIGISSGLTFDSSVEIIAYNPYGSAVIVVWHLFYALAP